MSNSDLSLESRRIYLDSVQAYEVFLAAEHELQKYAGTMRWKAVRGREYLIKRSPRGAERSLGPRSPETEAILQAFMQGKALAMKRYTQAEEHIHERAAFNRAARLNRVPWVVGQIARKLSQIADLAARTLLIGSNAIYAYEAAAGVRVDSGIVSTMDLDVLWDTRHKVKLAGLSSEGLMGLLRRVDQTFRPVAPAGHRGFRAVNAKGYMVDLIEPGGKDRLTRQPVSMSAFDDDLVAVEIKGMAWLISCPKFRAVAFDEKGYPVPMVVPDPRAFALHKHWLSMQADRDPLKRARDEAQARCVFSMTLQHFPHLPFPDAALRALPYPIRQSAMDWGYGG